MKTQYLGIRCVGQTHPYVLKLHLMSIFKFPTSPCPQARCCSSPSGCIHNDRTSPLQSNRPSALQPHQPRPPNRDLHPVLLPVLPLHLARPLPGATHPRRPHDGLPDGQTRGSRERLAQPRYCYYCCARVSSTGCGEGTYAGVRRE
jgi:hypothetical protein